MKSIAGAIIALATVTLVGCQRHPENDPGAGKAPEIVSIVHSPELRQIVTSAVESFEAKASRLPDGSPVHIDRIELPSADAANQIARGEAKPIMWIAPFPALAEAVNSNTVNLGARQTECRKIFSTPLVVAALKTERKKIFAGRQTPLRKDLANQEMFPHLLVPRADLTDTGLAYFAWLTEPDGGTVAASRYFGDPKRLLTVAATPWFGSPRVAVTSEQQVITYNREPATPTKALSAVYPGDSPPELQYTACISEADWLTAPQRVAARLFQNHLLSAEVQIPAQQFGFRAVQYVSEKLEIFSEQFGVEPLPPTSSRPLTVESAARFIKDRQLSTPPSATVYVIDTSASMNGIPLTTAKRLVRALMERSRDGDFTGVISFDADVKVVSPLTQKRNEIYPHLLGIETDAGSALYDSLLSAADELARDQFREMQRRIVLLTDGNDQSSRTVFSFFGSAFERRAGGREIALSIFLFPHEGTDISDLQQIISITGGTMTNFSAEMVPETYEQIINQG